MTRPCLFYTTINFSSIFVQLIINHNNDTNMDLRTVLEVRGYPYSINYVFSSFQHSHVFFINMGHHFFLIFCPAYHEHALDLGTPKTFKYSPLKPFKLKSSKSNACTKTPTNSQKVFLTINYNLMLLDKNWCFKEHFTQKLQ